MSRSGIRKGAWAHKDGCRFAVWAPHAVEVFMMGSFDDWDPGAHRLARDSDGTWSGDVPEAKPGDEYRYRIVADTAEHVRFESLLAVAFDQIRQNAEGNVAVLARLHQVLATVAGRTTDPQRQDALRQQAILITETVERSVPSAHDRAAIQAAQREG